MKKQLILFLITVVIFIVAKLAYTKYCETKKEGCKEEKMNDYDGSPEEGVDW